MTKSIRIGNELRCGKCDAVKVSESDFKKIAEATEDWEC
jgi:cytochrome c-type biogenesis protein CcmH/NrfF